MHSLFERELHEHGETDDGPVSVKISYTGMASANIDGRTYHSFLGIGKGQGRTLQLKDMQSVARASARDKHKALKVIIEDEISLGSLDKNEFMNDFFNLVFDVPENDISLLLLLFPYLQNYVSWHSALWQIVSDENDRKWWYNVVVT